MCFISANEMPNYNLANWLRSDGLGKKRTPCLSVLPHDVYVVGTQESCMSEKEWCSKLKSLLLENYFEEFYLVSGTL